MRRNKGLVSKESAMLGKILKLKPSKESAIDKAKLMTVIIDAIREIDCRLFFKVNKVSF